MKQLAIVLVLALAIIQSIDGRKAQSYSHCTDMRIRLKLKKFSCDDLESEIRNQLARAYQEKVLKGICKEKKGCEVQDFNGTCDEMDSYTIFLTITFTCRKESSCTKNSNNVMRLLKKKKAKITLGKENFRLKGAEVTAKPCPITEAPRAINPTIRKSTTLAPTTKASTTYAATTLPPATLAPPKPCYEKITNEMGNIINAGCCTTVCGSCKFSDDIGVLLILQSLTPLPDTCPGIKITDGECTESSHDYTKYGLPHSHISKSNCACVCFPQGCKPPPFKIFYGTYQKTFSELVNLVLELEESKALAADDEILPKLMTALCDRTKAISLATEPLLLPIIQKVPPSLAFQFLGKKKK